jgi:hypothetical protein
MILSHIWAVVGALIRSIQYATVLKISRRERVRYLKKSARLALCYAGFARPWSLKEAWKAGEAAFLSCAYDVVTDWRHFDKENRAAFENTLNDLSEPDLKDLALELYEKDSRNGLAADGLERGAIALKFILRMMGCERDREASWGDLTNLGELLQIVDDVFDYEDDVAAGEQNWLVSAKRDVYLTRLLEGLDRANCSRLFGSTPSVLSFAIAQARRKGTELLALSRGDAGCRSL